MHVSEISKHLAGQIVSHIVQERRDSIALHVASGSILVVETNRSGVTAALRDPKAKRALSVPDLDRLFASGNTSSSSTGTRCGSASLLPSFDIAQHFLVSPPSVNQMIKTLERRGFIARRRDSYGQALPWSIRIVAESL